MATKKVKQSPERPSPGAAPSTAVLDRAARLWTQFERFAWDIGGILCLAAALMTLLSLGLPRLAGGLLIRWADFLRLWFGWGSLWVVAAFFALGVWLLRRRASELPERVNWGRLVLLEGAAFISLALLALTGGASLARAEAGQDGGRLGWGLAEILRRLLEPLGLASGPLQGLFLLAALILLLVGGLDLGRAALALARRMALSRPETVSQDDDTPLISEAPLQSAAGAAIGGSAQRRKPALPPQFRKNFRIQDVEPSSTSAAPAARDEALPPLDLLVNEQFSRPDERNINLTAGLIEKTLAEFGIPARVVGFRVGPTVTQFAVEPGYVEKEKNGQEGDPNRQKVRVSQIASLSRDLTLALAAERLRIEAPVPGRPYVGIEVPNARSSVVRLRPILESEAYQKANAPLAVALGRDVSGAPVVADLARMPHLLIAGTTGSGKSVCIAALTTCLVMNNSPQDLRLVMIDPKMVELIRFNGLPHLIGKVETDLERILAVLRWTVAEMDRRYKILEASRSRNLDSYNRKARRRKEMEYLPHLVVMIDELADLMMSAPDQTEHNLVRLAQMARATGIHLVVATQRPGVDVVTGLIKANFPARISFAVASSVDSRVILDINGAETLLGRGDMLYLAPDASGPSRLQGVMVSDQEVERVITFWQKAQPAAAGETPPWEELLASEQGQSERDDLLERAIEVVRQTQRASASLLQRRLHIGYPRAARLIDELEEMGIIGPAVAGGRERQVLLGRDSD